MKLAERQGGCVSHGQLRDCGYTDNAIARRVLNGWFVRVKPGVYRVGPIASPLNEEWAAVLWAGGDAHVGDHSAAHVYGTLTRPPLVHITVTSHNPGRTTGVRVHRPKHLPEHDRRLHQGLPVTSPLRTLVDCAADMGEAALERLLAEFQIKHLVTDYELQAAAATGRPGMAMLRAILDDTHGLTRSEAERMLRRLIRDAGLPQPRMNAEIGEHEFDAFWPEYGLLLEFHGYGPHRTRKKFETDAVKSAAAASLGLRLMHATWRRLQREPLALVADIATALAVRQVA